MKLYLVQHGEATSEKLDPARPLTQKGRSEVSKIAKFLKETGIEVDVIWHSTKTRAMQTAQILAEAVSPKECTVERQGLAPNDSVDELQKELASRELDLMIVGHLPFLQKLASTLLLGSEFYDLVGFRQGGAVCLQREEGAWRLIWAIIPELI